jgi:hypothetical protein
MMRRGQARALTSQQAEVNRAAPLHEGLKRHPQRFSHPSLQILVGVTQRRPGGSQLGHIGHQVGL